MPLLESVSPAQLELDRSNPRVPDETFETADDALRYLYTHADLDELIQSIGNSGWLDFEPLIVERGSNTVIEGNRRLAALRIIAEPRLQRELKVTLPEPLNPGANPDLIQVNYVESRKEARDFIGFKHVNGAFKWDSYAKAKFAHSWLKEGDSIDEVSRRLGDGHNTISRLVNGVVVLDQAENHSLFNKEERTKRSFYFSHLYTALPNANVRNFLGLPENNNDVLPEDPVPREKWRNLHDLLSWLYGQGDELTVIRSQNPDLGRLVSVLGNPRATNLLISTRELNRAFDLIEDRGRAFEKSFYKLLAASEEVSSMIGRYDPESDLLEDAQTVRRSVDSIVEAMKKAHARESDSDAS